MQGTICGFWEAVRSRSSFPQFVVFSHLVVFTMLAAVGAASPALAATGSPAAGGGWSDLPLEGRYAISGAVGREAPAYHGAATARGLAFSNPSQSLAVRFEADGVRMDTGEARLDWRFTRIGRGEALAEVEPAAPRLAEANRVEYAYPGVEVWYVNGPYGLQQGFTLARRPAGRAGRVTVAMRITAGGEPVGIDVAAGGREALLVDDAGETLRYGGLLAWDAKGRDLPVELAAVDGALQLRVDDADAAYPVTIDPFVQQAKLRPQLPGGDTYFGNAVAISGDTVVVGCAKCGFASEIPELDETEMGFAYVFKRPSDGWSGFLEHTAELSASDGNPFDNFGYSVAISGNTVVVGTIQNGIGGNEDQGSVYIFESASGNWSDRTETARLVASDGEAFDEFGNSVATSGDIVAVGARKYDQLDILAVDTGAVYIFERPSGGWTNSTAETAVLTHSDAADGDQFGTSVALSEDGTMLVAGAPAHDVDGVLGNAGAAYVFESTGTPSISWQETARLVFPGGGQTGARWGQSVAVSGDGGIVAIGAPLMDLDVMDQGAVYIVVRPDPGWLDTFPVAELNHSSPQGGDEFGRSVAVSEDGDMVLVGVGNRAHGAELEEAGSVYAYKRSATGWTGGTEDFEVRAADANNLDQFGHAVALSGETAVAGAPIAFLHETGLSGIDHGAAYVLQTCAGAHDPKPLAVNTWTMIGLPCEPKAPANVESVFGDDLDPGSYTTRWVVYSFDPHLDSYTMLGLSDKVTAGEGYWMITLDAAELDVSGDYAAPITYSDDCVSPAGCFGIPLVPALGQPEPEQFNLIGHPFPHSIDWEYVRVRTGDGTLYPLDSAHENEIMSRTFYKYNGTEYEPFDDVTVGMEGTLNEFDGIWVHTLDEARLKSVEVLIPVHPELPPVPDRPPRQGSGGPD